MRFVFIGAEKATYPVVILCRVLRVSPSGFYAWRHRTRSARTQADHRLRHQIVALHTASRGTYGSPRLHRALQHQGLGVSRKRVVRLMRAAGLAAQRPRRFRHTTDSTHPLPVAANVLGRHFAVAAPDRVWAADITYVWTGEGWLYVAVILDVGSRRVVGWALADHLRTELPLNALAMALGRRRPGAQLLHHSDRGSQYASAPYRRLLAQHAIRSSMSRKGDCWDNAVVESFWATLKTELVHRQPWPTRRAVRSAIVEYIESFYNGQRLHSALGYRTPVDYEATFKQCKTPQAA